MVSKKIKHALNVVVRLALAAGLAGWLCMVFTEETIWSQQSPHCPILATIELKGNVYRTCSYLVTRYRIGESAFMISVLIMAAGVIAGRLRSRDR